MKTFAGGLFKQWQEFAKSNNFDVNVLDFDVNSRIVYSAEAVKSGQVFGKYTLSDGGDCATIQEYENEVFKQ